MATRQTCVKRARRIVGLAALAFPLFVTGAAQAAIAGALPATTTGRPDIRSATLLSATTAEVCYDKTVQLGTPAIGGYVLGGYRSANFSAANTGANLDPTNTNCVILTFTAAIGDPTQYTVLEGAAGATTGNASGLGSLADSVALTGSSTHSGTTGVTTAPNLVGVLAPTGSNQITDSITFVFDKTAHVISPGQFFYYDSAGQKCAGQTVLNGQDSTTITIAFGTTVGQCATNGAASNVAGAQRAGVLLDGVISVSDTSSGNPPESTIVPSSANGGATQHPDLVSAALGSNKDQIVYTFDKPVTVLGSGANEFEAELSNAKTVFSTGAVGTGGTTVTATFNGHLSAESEYAVAAWVFPGAVAAADNVANPNIGGSANIGDNAGAFARGFTTGPDVFGVTINHTTGAVVVNVDQRLGTSGGTPVNTGAITLLDGTGSPITTTTPTPSFNSSAAPGPEAVTLQYPPSSLTNVTQLQFNATAFTSPLTDVNTTAFGVSDAQNIQQVDAGVTSGAILKGFKAFQARHAHAKHHKGHKHHKAHKAHKAK